jgi:Undecaprenyl-phosphate galactose phosphotransferase WbaP
LPPQQLGELPEARPPKIGARAVPMRPHLVSGPALDVDVESATEGSFPAEVVRHALVMPHWRSARTTQGRDLTRANRRSTLERALKRTFDVVGAIVLGVVFSPLMIVISLLLRSEGGCVLYRHRRVGRNGRAFECLKFRSMVPDADRVLRELLEHHPELQAEWVRDHKLRCDPRVTVLGKFLRRTSLDELPQVWNVLRGDMSLVGPRPVVGEELMRYGRCLSVYLSAKPGITGLWQVTGRNDINYRRRVALDVYYVRRYNLLLDMYILLKTMRVVLGGRGAY